MSSNVTAVVLAAGTSSRMWPLGDKHLLRFAGQRLAGLHLRNLAAAGIERCVVVGNAGNIEALRAETSALSIEAAVLEQRRPHGMAGAVLDAISALGESDLGRPVYVTQPHDVVAGQLHAEVLQAGSRSGAYAQIAGTVAGEHFPGGYLALDGDRVTGIIEKPPAGSEPSDVVTIVAHLFADARPLFEALQRETEVNGADDAYERALNQLAERQDVRVVRYDGAWCPVKYPWHVLDVVQLVLEQAQRGEIDLGPRYRQAEPGVFVGEGVKVFPGARIAAPCIVGHGTVVGDNALVRDSIVGDGCAIGFGSEVARSYIGDGCQLHHNYAGDSVLDRDVLFGFGTITANFRLDERTVKSTVQSQRIDTGRAKLGLIAGAGAKIGVGTNVMPGVKIGAGAVVGPGQVVWSDVADNERLFPPRDARSS